MAEVNGPQFAPGDKVRISGSLKIHTVIAVRTETFPHGGLQQIVKFEDADPSWDHRWMRAAHFVSVEAVLTSEQ